MINSHKNYEEYNCHNNHFIRKSDRIPILSTVVSAVTLAANIFLNFVPNETIWKNKTLTHIQERSSIRCITALVPILGNLILYAYDRYIDHDDLAVLSLNTRCGNDFSYRVTHSLLCSDKNYVVELLDEETKGNEPLKRVRDSDSNHFFRSQFRSLPKRLQQDRDIVLLFVKTCPSIFSCLDKKFLADRGLILEGIKVHGSIIQYATKELQKDKELLLEAFKDRTTSLYLPYVHDCFDGLYSISEDRYWNYCLDDVIETLTDDQDFICKLAALDTYYVKYIEKGNIELFRRLVDSNCSDKMKQNVFLGAAKTDQERVELRNLGIASLSARKYLFLKSGILADDKEYFLSVLADSTRYKIASGSYHFDLIENLVCIQYATKAVKNDPDVIALMEQKHSGEIAKLLSKVSEARKSLCFNDRYVSRVDDFKGWTLAGLEYLETHFDENGRRKVHQPDN